MSHSPTSPSRPSPSPSVSVIIPTHERPHLLRRAVASVFAQTLQPTEIVIVNDGGGPLPEILLGEWDRTPNHPPKSAPPQINIHSLPKQSGPAAARNYGVQRSQGEYIAYLDDDDIYLPHHLEKMFNCISSSPGGMYYSHYIRAQRIGEERLGEEGLGEEGSLISREEVTLPILSIEELLIKNWIATPTVIHHRRVFEEAGGFDEWLTALEDWDLWIRVSAKHPPELVPSYEVEVTQWSDRPSLSQTHRHGYAWPLVNCLYKYAEHTPERYYQGALEAILFLTQKLVQAAEHENTPLHTMPVWRSLFSHHSPVTVRDRIPALKQAYSASPEVLLALDSFQALLELLDVEL